MWQQFAKGNIEKKILPGSDLHNISLTSARNLNLSLSNHDYIDNDGQGRNYVMNEYEKEDEEYNEVLLNISFYSTQNFIF